MLYDDDDDGDEVTEILIILTCRDGLLCRWQTSSVVRLETTPRGDKIVTSLLCPSNNTKSRGSRCIGLMECRPNWTGLIDMTVLSEIKTCLYLLIIAAHACAWKVTIFCSDFFLFRTPCSKVTEQNSTKLSHACSEASIRKLRPKFTWRPKAAHFRGGIIRRHPD